MTATGQKLQFVLFAERSSELPLHLNERPNSSITFLVLSVQCRLAHEIGKFNICGLHLCSESLHKLINSVILDRKPPLIVTLKLDAVSFERLNELRRIHFPPERNFLSAHVTLFHALPGEELPAICSHLQRICARTAPMHIAFPRVQMLGRGVAIEVISAELQLLHDQLAACFSAWLTPQDRQRFRPHVTIQNKVLPQQARELYDALAPTWEMPSGQSAGLLLWEYRGGPWLGIEEFSFTGA